METVLTILISAKSTGIDAIYGFGGDDILTLTGANNLLGYVYRSSIYGGEGNDRITVSNSIGVNVFGEGGNNNIIVDNSSQINVSAGINSNTVTFNNVKAGTIVTGELNDVVSVNGHSFDAIIGSTTNSISSAGGNDTIFVTTQANMVNAGNGDDKINL